jgi:hypothetical protein
VDDTRVGFQASFDTLRAPYRKYSPSELAHRSATAGAVMLAVATVLAKKAQMRSTDQTRRRGFVSLMILLMAVLLFTAAKTAYDITNEPVETPLDARIVRYFSARPDRFCILEGVWHDWERDETMTLGCLMVKSRSLRQGSYKFETGPRATSTFSITGTYDIGSDSTIRATGKDREGKTVRIVTLIAVEDLQYPTQIFSVDEDGEPGFFIWKRKN